MAAAVPHGLPTPNSTQTSASVLASTPAHTSTNTSSKRKASTTNTNSKKSKSKTSRRSRKTANSDTDDDDEPVFDPAELKNSQKTAVELRCLAVKFATSGLTEAILESVLEFHEEMETLIAIKALELGITVSDIEKVFGKYVGIRRPSPWNRFLQSPTARATFKAARGVSSGEGMKMLSQVWKNMTQEERDAYKEATQETDSTTLQDLDDQLEAIDVGSQSRHTILQSRSNMVVNPRNLLQYKRNAEDFMDGLLTKVTRNTVGLNRPVNMIYDLEGVQNFPAQLQALIVGKSTTDLALDLADNTSRGLHRRVTKSLSRYLKATTGLAHWPWTNCDSTLGNLGFKLKLLPGARSQLQTFKTPSNQLNQARLLALEADLQENMIQLVRSADINPQTLDTLINTNPTQTCHTIHNQIPNIHSDNSSTSNELQNHGQPIITDFNRSQDNNRPIITDFNRSQDNHRPINFDPSLV
ncbi:hypothetical protein DFH28DRAFT_1102191 [Melampsora americana]|nr:hypothetical protein DFH28DRAFT_1102191 [Melampsora americana]